MILLLLYLLVYFTSLLHTNEIIENAKQLFVQGNRFSIIESMIKICP